MKTDPNMHIDESKLKSSPGFLLRLRNAFASLVMAIVLAQVLLFAFGFGSIVLYWSHPVFWVYLLICTVTGFVVGERFIGTLGRTSSDWWDLWGFFGRK